MPKPNPNGARALNWTQRADDWMRLAGMARNDYVHDICQQFAGWSYDMADFWGGVPG